jgi:hypothetical protein
MIVPVGAAEKRGWGSGTVGVGVGTGSDVGEGVGGSVVVAVGEGDGVGVTVGSKVTVAVGVAIACDVGPGTHAARARLTAMSNNFANRIMSITATPARLQSQCPPNPGRMGLLSSLF